LPNCSLTVKALLEMWLSLRSTEIKASSYQHYLALIQGQIVPRLGNIRVSNLTAEIISGFIKELLAHGRMDGKGGLSKSTIIGIMNILRSAIRLAGKKYAIRDVALFDVKGPKVPQTRVDTLSSGECEALAHCVLADPDLSGAAYLLALSSGLRLGEICALKWSDIRFAEKELSIQRTVLRLKIGNRTQLVEQTPKTESAVRVIPLTSEMLTLLTRLRDGAGKDAFILTGKRQPMEPRTLQKRFQRFLTEHGLRRIKIHTLRHTFATRSIESGFDAKTVSELLGHKSVKTTLQLYVHPSMQRKREIVETVSVLLPALT
jgi:integrase